MRIGVDYTAGAYQGAGIGHYTRGLMEALTRLDRRNDYRLFVAGTGGAFAQVHWPDRVRLTRLPLSQRTLTRIWHRLHLPLYVECLIGSLDCFYSPDFVLPPVRRARTLLTVHDLSFVRHPETADPRLYRYLNAAVPRSVRRADHLLADSWSTARDIITLWGVPSSRVSVVYPGVEPRFHVLSDGPALDQVRERYRLPRRFMLSVGTLQPRKNYERLIQAFGQWRNGQRSSARDTKLLIVGGRGWLCESIFDSVRRLGLKGEVRFLGFVTDEDLPALYGLASCFLFPSLYEGFGIPVLEAMACGVPVLCSNASSLPEVAGDAAVLVDPLDVAGWAASMGQVLSDEELRRELVGRGLAQARQFTWERAAQEWLAICQALVG